MHVYFNNILIIDGCCQHRWYHHTCRLFPKAFSGVQNKFYVYELSLAVLTFPAIGGINVFELLPAITLLLVDIR
jgi:hypothetical protein